MIQYRIFDDEEGHRRVDQISNGMVYSLEPLPEDMERVPGYYDQDLKLITPDEVDKAFDPNQPRDDQGQWSAEGGGGGANYAADDLRVLETQRVKRTVERVAQEEGFPIARIEYSDEVKEFEVDGTKMVSAGTADLGSGNITIYPNQITSYGARGVMVHEIMHQRYASYLYDLADERDTIPDEAYAYGPEHTGELNSPDAPLKPQYAQQFPLYAANYRTEGGSNAKELRETDGVTAYSKKYWADYSRGKVSWRIAVHETLAEMARLDHQTGLSGSSSKVWQDLYQTVKKYGRLPSA